MIERSSKSWFSLIGDVLRSIPGEQRRRKCTKHFMTMGIADVLMNQAQETRPFRVSSHRLLDLPRERATRATKSRVVDLCPLQEFKSH